MLIAYCKETFSSCLIQLDCVSGGRIRIDRQVAGSGRLETGEWLVTGVRSKSTSALVKNRHRQVMADRQRSGQIVRLNEKTVTLNSDGQKWRVAYALLHRVIDVTAAEPIAGQIITR